MAKVIVLGAGIAGLATAWCLKKEFGQKIEIDILEKSDRSGGWIHTVQKDGFLFELGPRSCRPKGNGIYTLKLIEELGLENEVIAGDEKSKIRYIYQNGSLKQLPTSFFSLVFSTWMPAMLRAAFKDLLTPKGTAPDESIDAFARRRFSPKIADELFDPFCSGIFAGDSRQLSLKSCFPFLDELEKKHRSILKGVLHSTSQHEALSPFVFKMKKTPLFSFKNGMQTLPDALAKHLNPSIHFSTSAKKVFLSKGSVKIETDAGKVHEGDFLVSTVSAPALSLLLGDNHSEVSQLLRSIPMATIAVVNVGYRAPVLKKRGFGYLIPSSEKNPVLGIVFDSNVFLEQNHTENETRLTVMIGGARMPEIIQMDESDIKQTALDVVRNTLNINDMPDAVEIKLAKYAIPQYVLNHAQNILKIEANLQDLPLAILGNSLYGVAINDLIANAYRFAGDRQKWREWL